MDDASKVGVGSGDFSHKTLYRLIGIVQVTTISHPVWAVHIRGRQKKVDALITEVGCQAYQLFLSHDPRAADIWPEELQGLRQVARVIFSQKNLER